MLAQSEVSFLPEKALWMPAEQLLVIADLHFGKAQHFRRAGLPVPTLAGIRNAENLIDLLRKTNPLTTIFLGDLFHSHYNDDWEAVGQIVRHFSSCRFELVRGNHDIMSEQQYVRQGIFVTEEARRGPFLFSHEPLDRSVIPAGIINVAGHIHPGARLEGKGKQSLMLPCFWRSANQLILPAFGSLTGLASILPAATDSVYLVLEDKVMEWNQDNITVAE